MKHRNFRQAPRLPLGERKKKIVSQFLRKNLRLFFMLKMAHFQFGKDFLWYWKKLKKTNFEQQKKGAGFFRENYEEWPPVVLHVFKHDVFAHFLCFTFFFRPSKKFFFRKIHPLKISLLKNETNSCPAIFSRAPGSPDFTIVL